MIACLDVDYQGDEASVAAVVFQDWQDGAAAFEKVIRVGDVKPYQPGEFFRRELPCLLAVLEGIPDLHLVIIDGYVWLDEGRPGLGAHLHEALQHRLPVIGVAKTSYKGSQQAALAWRGDSQRPLYITAAGLPNAEAAAHVQTMHGPYRIPTLLKRADQLCRGRASVI